MQLNLTRPLVFFDLETTGVNISTDRIVEIACVKVFPDGTSTSWTTRVNPEVHIPESSSSVHHITDEDVKDAPTFAQIADTVLDIFHDSDIAGFYSNKFDVPLLMAELARTGREFSVADRLLIDVQSIYHHLEQRTLIAAYRHYCGKELEGAHGALADTMATYEVLKAQLDYYEESDEFGNDMTKLARLSMPGGNVDLAGRFTRNSAGQITFNFGKHRGKVVADVLRTEPGYYAWMMQGDFAKDTKDVLTSIYVNSKKK